VHSPLTWILLLPSLRPLLPHLFSFPDTKYGICTEYDNSTVGEQETFAIRYIWDALLDWQVRARLAFLEWTPYLLHSSGS
jgi:hypothetical protein